jgi:adenine-specific DNA methylase
MSTTLVNTQSFIEAQFPVSKLSKESYKERKSNHSQTLTGLGKWWGRKPLILVRATLLGLLLPATDDPARDREIYLKLLTMDEDGLWRRKGKGLPIGRIVELLAPEEVARHFPNGVESRRRLSDEERRLREEAERLAFNRMTYDERLDYCGRPEQVDGPSPEAWMEINAHLGTNACNLPELVHQLGERCFGRVPRVGDTFSGGGSIPFEAARIGCEAYGSDLNPVAALLTWSALNIVGGGDEVAEQVRGAQRQVYDAVDRQITAWGIEHNDQGWRADAYLYCVETDCPECGVSVPMAPSWVIGERTRTVAKLRLDSVRRGYDIDIVEGASDEEMRVARQGTVADSTFWCPACQVSTPLVMLRGDRRGDQGTEFGLRLWENDDLVPRSGDVFGERLYCIRWVEKYLNGKGEEKTRRHYRAPDERDRQREEQVLQLLRGHFAEWQREGYIPSRRIEPGVQTTKPIRTRGWTYWHHMFNPRQLLTLGLLSERSQQLSGLPATARASLLLALGKCADYSARQSRWDSNAANEKVKQVFSNQSLSPLYSYGVQSLLALASVWFLGCESEQSPSSGLIQVIDARAVERECDLWITDPPYADAVSYDQLSEFFLAWYDKPLQRIFPAWYTDSKRALAVSGSDENFRQSMVECYRNLAEHMSDDGLQVVMFTHQDASVWADLALILWAAGLRVTAAWTIATETDSALKTGNYVQGTVLLVLRKQTSDQVAFLDEIYPEVEAEVRSQLDVMLGLDADDRDRNFADTDYQLAAYAAALRVLTSYHHIQDLNVARELAKPQVKGQTSPVERIIADAMKVAADHLVPQGFDVFTWKMLAPEERFYLKGLDLESHGELRGGAYQELARGFGIREYRDLLGSGVANETRLKSATEFGTRTLHGEGFASSLVRHCLFAVREAVASESVSEGRQWLRTELSQQYWTQRRTLVEILRYMASRGQHLRAWRAADAAAARLVAGAVENDSV